MHLSYFVCKIHAYFRYRSIDEEEPVLPNSNENVKLFVSDNYPCLITQVNEFELLYASSDEVIQAARNTIKKVDISGTKVVVKSFKIPHGLQGFIYKYLRRSKARRSYEYAECLLAKGINTPAPIAYIEKYNKKQLLKSYFVSQLLDYDFEIRDVLNNKTEDKKRLLEEFAAFTYRLHENGILHLDYSTGNVLIKKCADGSYQFSVVDINRMRFGQVSLDEGIKNFNRISVEAENIAIFSQVYAQLSGMEVSACEKLMSQSVEDYQAGRARKKQVKKILGLG